MKTLNLLVSGASALLLSGLISSGEIKPIVEHNPSDAADAGFVFQKVPPPSKNDAATTAKFTLVDGHRDPNGGDLNALNDGKVAPGEDEPSSSFFFSAGTDGGRIAVDLTSIIEIKQINTYSWHGSSRGPQVYTLFASNGKKPKFNAQPARGTDPEKCGWTRIAKVNTCPKTGESGGQYGVSIAASKSIGKYRYLLFDIERTEKTDPFGNTFFTEIDVVDRNGPAPEPVTRPVAQVAKETVEIDGGKYKLVIDTSEMPDMTEWTHEQIAPMAQEWYPKLIKMLPSEGFEPPKNFSITFKKDKGGVADTGGTRINCAGNWMRQNMKGESKGAIFHEMVHVVQQYGWGRRQNPNATSAPSWLTEGITDYIRFYIFERETHGAEISKRALPNAKYNNSYRVTANFLNWMIETHDKDLILKLNSTIREGRYTEEFWKKYDGHSLPELGDAWKEFLAKKLGVDLTVPTNTTTNAPAKS